jgi:hypothetical protein
VAGSRDGHRKGSKGSKGSQRLSIYLSPPTAALEKQKAATGVRQPARTDQTDFHNTIVKKSSFRCVLTAAQHSIPRIHFATGGLFSTPVSSTLSNLTTRVTLSLAILSHQSDQIRDKGFSLPSLVLGQVKLSQSSRSAPYTRNLKALGK